MNTTERLKEFRDTAGEKASQIDTAIDQTANSVPTNLFLVATAASIGLSLAFKLTGRHRDAEFVGHWAPTFLGLGLLSKMIQHDRRDR